MSKSEVDVQDVDTNSQSDCHDLSQDRLSSMDTSHLNDVLAGTNVLNAGKPDSLGASRLAAGHGRVDEEQAKPWGAQSSASEPRPSAEFYVLRPTTSWVHQSRPPAVSVGFEVPDDRPRTLEIPEELQLFSQGVPPELGNVAREIVFVITCSSGQLLFSFFQGNMNVNQEAFKKVLELENTQLPWIANSFLMALGLSVILAGPLADLVSPKIVVLLAFAWLGIWNLIGCFCLKPSLSMLYFLVRGMQGLAVGVLVSGSMSILGRVYNPGLRKTRVFSAMAAGAPFGFGLGALQGGALSAHLRWIFATNAMMCSLLLVAACLTIPTLRPAADVHGAEVPGLSSFDYRGAICAVIGCICLLTGLTQGSIVAWAPYTYTLILLSFAVFGLFIWIEKRAPRPMIPNRLWRTPGLAPLMAAYFFGFGGYAAWQFYALQFFLRLERRTALTVGLYILPNAVMGVVATVVVSRLLHLVPGHFIYGVSMLAFAAGPTCFLPQTVETPYWMLSMPGIALASFGPDLSFAAASIFITSNVARSYQGSAGSLLVMIQNLSSAMMTSMADVIGTQVDATADGDVGLEGLRAIWWFCFTTALAGAVITVMAVRIPKEVEKAHLT